MKIYLKFFLFLFLTAQSCSSLKQIPEFDTSKNPLSPDYSNLDFWAAHPDKLDPSDRIPASSYTQDYSQSTTDVFFIHPTTYTSKKGELQWNADILDKELNQKTDSGTILFQASAFNSGGRVFAPRYRQTHINAYFSKDKESAKTAFELAYSDVKAAFEHYLKYENKGRPIIIASHSQGTTHAGPLIKEFFDGKDLQFKLVAAYLIGMPVKDDYFENITPCNSPEQINCFISWRTFKKGTIVDNDIKNILVTNPISWKTDTILVTKDQNLGSLLADFDKIYPSLVDAQVHEGVLWSSKPKFRGSFFFRAKNYHIADINFFYFDIKKNVKERIHQYYKNK